MVGCCSRAERRAAAVIGCRLVDLAPHRNRGWAEVASCRARFSAIFQDGVRLRRYLRSDWRKQEACVYASSRLAVSSNGWERSCSLRLAMICQPTRIQRNPKRGFSRVIAA
eukprot:scaffold495_cov243-Pinguiococcus_pyrenoidosus.AAC.44